MDNFKALLDASVKVRIITRSEEDFKELIQPKECYESIKRCFDKGEISTITIHLKNVEMELKQERGVVISRCKRNEHNKFITDAIKSMSWWACFKDENEKKKSNESLNFDYEKAMKFIENMNKEEKIKIGRNDSCPCGSGKKYNKCCGKNT